jgi:hypothetical protein
MERSAGSGVRRAGDSFWEVLEVGGGGVTARAAVDLEVAGARARAPILLLRVAALATDALEPLRCRAVLEHARRVEAALDRLEARRRGRCSALHRLGLTLSHADAAHHALVELERAVHDDRPPAAPLAALSLGDVFARIDGLREDLIAWEADVRAYRDALRDGPAAVRDDWARVHAGLARAWRDDLLQRGVLHAHPELYRAVEQALGPAQDPPGAPGGREPRWALSLLAHVYRAVTQTSPFSTLTLTAVGRPAPAEDARRFSVPEPAELGSRLVLSPELVGALARRWLADPSVAARAPLRAPELAEADDDRIVFLHADAPSRGKPTIEVICTLIDSPVAAVALRLLREVPGPHDMDSFRRLLGATLGCADPEAGFPPHALDDGVEEALGGLLQQLQELGLFRPAVEYDACRPDALDGLVRATAALGATAMVPGLALAMSIAERLRSLAGRPARLQAAGLAAAHIDLRRLLGDSVEIRPGRAIVDRAGLLRTVDVPAAALRWIGPGLRQILDVLPLFNVEHGAERLVQGFFRGRCAGGAVLPVLPAFAELRDFVQEHFGGEGPDAFVRAAEEREATSEVAWVRRALIAELRELVDGTAEPVRSLPDGFLRRWADQARLYAPRRAPLAAAFLGQLIDTGDAGRPRFVLDRVAAGYGALAAAWVRAGDRVGDREPAAGAYLGDVLAEELRALDPDGDVVEIAAALEYSGQVRERVTPRVLSYPGEPSSPDPERRIDWSRLGLAFDAELDRVVLVHRRTRRRVLPLHLGTLSASHYPAFYRFLMALGPAFTPALSLIDLFEDAVPEAERQAPRRYERIVAEPIVLSRDTWCVPSNSLPRLGTGRPSFADFLGLRRWARELDLPRRVYVAGGPPAEPPRAGLSAGAPRRSRRPLCVDFDELASCALLCRFLRRVGPTVRFTEVLPLPEQNPFRDDRRGRTVECVLEVRSDADLA